MQRRPGDKMDEGNAYQAKEPNSQFRQQEEQRGSIGKLGA
jgi:hypothetical protein